MMHNYLYLDNYEGNITMCPWMEPTKSSIGNLMEDEIEDAYNSDYANYLRSTMDDQSFKYCRLEACPYLQNNTLEEISKLDGIDVIQSQGDLADKITAVKNGIGVAGIWIIAILMIISLVIVSNTIRVTMYNRKLEISIMKAVGATDAFVRIPFVVEGVLIGLISALISEGLLYFCYRVATETILTTLGTSDIVKYEDMALLLLGVFVGIGVFAGILGSFIMIRKYLKHEGSEFAAI